MTRCTEGYRAGLANRIMLYFGTLAGGILLKIVLNDLVTDVIAETDDQCDVAACTQGVDWVELAWDWLPLWILVLGAALLLGGAIIEARRTP